MNEWLMRFWLKGFGTVDMVLAVMVLFGMIRGLRNGLAKEAVLLIELYAAAVLGIQLSLKLADRVSAFTQLPIYFVHGIVFSLLGVVIVIAAKILFKLLSQLGSLQFSGLLERAGGVLVGALRYAMLMSLVSYALLLFRSPYLNEAYVERSRSGQFSATLPQVLHHETIRFLDRLTVASRL